MVKPSNTYKPIDELLQTPLLRLLRGLSRFDWVAMGELFDAIGVEEGWESTQRNSMTVALGRCVRNGQVDRRGPHSLRQYKITDVGRGLLAHGFERAAIVEQPKRVVRRPGRYAGKAHPWTAEKQRASYWARKAARRCVDCNAGLQEDDGVSCVECREYRAAHDRSPKVRQRRNASSNAWAKRNKAKRAEIQRARYWAKKVAGICVCCALPATDDSLWCATHGEIANDRTRRQARARRAAAKRAA